MHSTVVLIILLFPWTLLGAMLVGALAERLHLRKVPVRSR
jgi:hypothetical protein